MSDQSIPATELDAGRNGYTHTELEESQSAAGATELDNTPVAGQLGTIRRNLPPPLAAEYDMLGLLGRGSQAEVYSVVHKDTGAAATVKLYTTPNHRLNSSVTNLIESADPRHILPTKFGQWGDEQWEIQELMGLGTLAEIRDHNGPNLSPDMLAAITQELSSAVAYAHSLKLIHRDIKPRNVLVRTLEPLDLVLSDFGLARELIAGSESGSTSHSVGYAAPEVLRGENDFPADWWAVGITLYEVHENRYPFTDDAGRRWNDARIVAHLLENEVDVSAFDPRWQLLLRGLLTKDATMRWKGSQVSSWLAGESPEVAQRPAREADRSDDSWVFVAPNWRTFEGTAALGNALIDDWEQAGAWLSGRSSQATAMRTSLGRSAHATETNDVFDRFARDAIQVDGLVFELGMLLAPRRVLTFRGRELTSAGLGAVATEASRGSTSAGDWITRLRAAHILQNTYANPQYAAFTETDSDLADYWDAVDELQSELTSAQRSYMVSGGLSADTAPQTPIRVLIDTNRAHLEGELLRVALSDTYRKEVHAAAKALGAAKGSAAWMDPLLARIKSGSDPAADVMLPTLRELAASDGQLVENAKHARDRATRSAARKSDRARRRGVANRRFWLNVCVAILYVLGVFVAFALNESLLHDRELDTPAVKSLASELGIVVGAICVTLWLADYFLDRPARAPLAILFPLAVWMSWGALDGSDHAWRVPAIYGAVGYIAASVISRARLIERFGGALNRPLRRTGRPRIRKLRLVAGAFLAITPATMLWLASPATQYQLPGAIAQARAEMWPLSTSFVQPVMDLLNDVDRFPSGTPVSWAIPAGLAALVLLFWGGRGAPETWLEGILLVVAVVGLVSAATLLWTLFVSTMVFVAGLGIIVGVAFGILALIISMMASA